MLTILSFWRLLVYLSYSIFMCKFGQEFLFGKSIYFLHAFLSIRKWHVFYTHSFTLSTIVFLILIWRRKCFTYTTPIFHFPQFPCLILLNWLNKRVISRQILSIYCPTLYLHCSMLESRSAYDNSGMVKW